MTAPRREASRFASFVVTGGVAALANIGARMLFSEAMRYELAVALAYLVGMTVAFVLAKRFVFTATGGRVAAEYLRFALVNAVSFAQVWLVSVGLDRIVFPAIGFTWRPEDVAHVIGVVSPVVLSYYLHKHFSFRRAPRSA